MSAPLLLDLFCGQGGASAGYAAAGFEVVGVDLSPQPRYPYRFYQEDALAALDGLFVRSFDAIHASPPCQGYSNAQRIRDRDHPLLIDALRERLEATRLPYVIENVVGAPLKNPIMLCGATLGLRTYRHRLFESNVTLAAPEHREHLKEQQAVKMGRALQHGDFYQAVGNFISVDYVRQDMGVGWMSRNGIRECIPPVYSEHIGRQLLEHIS